MPNKQHALHTLTAEEHAMPVKAVRTESLAQCDSSIAVLTTVLSSAITQVKFVLLSQDGYKLQMSHGRKALRKMPSKGIGAKMSFLMILMKLHFRILSKIIYWAKI